MRIAVPDGQFDAFVARPATSGPAPAVVVIQEIFGVNEDLRATCCELASAGFIAVSPDLFWRDEPNLDLNAWSEAEWSRALALYQKFDFDRGVSDVAATIAAVRGLEGCTGQVGVTGFCMGGLMTFLAAARTDVDAAAAYYGGSTQDYLDETGGITAPIILHLAEEDEFMPKEAQDRIRAAVSPLPNANVYSYPGCSHAFARHTGAHYDRPAAELANSRTFDFFRENLK